MENKKKSLWQFFQMLGKTFMFPIALLSVCAVCCWESDRHSQIQV